VLQRLRLKQVTDWHARLLRTGDRNGGPLSARTVGHGCTVPCRLQSRTISSHARVALIASKELDIVQISRRLGHKNANATLKIYAHLFTRDDRAAAAVMEAVMTGKER
jgi:integrase